MPAARLLRDWTNSDKVNSISLHAERFFTRLIMKVDDYGCFYADPRILKANLFPLLLDAIREADISRWTTECQKAGLIALYESEGKMYLQILDFNQRLRQKRQIFPLPSEKNACQQHVSNMSATCQPELEVEVEVEEEVEVEPKDNRQQQFFEQFRRVSGRHISDDELLVEVGKFINKYPNMHPNQSGGLINTWVSNIGKQPFKNTQPKIILK